MIDKLLFQPSDFKDFGFFEPQKLVTKLNAILQKKFQSICQHPKAKWTKLAEIYDEAFKSLEYGFKCPDCGKRVKPLHYVDYFNEGKEL